MNTKTSDNSSPSAAAPPPAVAAGQAPAPAEDKRLTIADLKKAASGKWHHIFAALAPQQLEAALAYAPEHVPCPHHGGHDGYRLFIHYNETGRSVCNTCGIMGSGLDTLMLVTGWSLTETVRKVADWLGTATETAKTVAQPAPVMKPRVDPAVAYRRLAEVWKASLPLKGSVAEKYLQGRGIWDENMPASLRAHEGLPYVHGRERTFYGKYPCLLASIRNTDRALVSIHRTFLTPDGRKAPVPDAKKLMSQHMNLKGCAIQLYPAVGDTLGLAEGVETAIAAHCISRMPVWACITAVLMEQVEVPKHIKRLVIWGDRDVSERGIQASQKLAERMEEKGIAVELYLPNCPIPSGEKGVDWHDVLLSQGVNGFPAKWRCWRPTPATAV
jgi:hypothetical protein